MDIEELEKCPAPAGMIPRPSARLGVLDKVPRTCGDDPIFQVVVARVLVSAPHLRG